MPVIVEAPDGIEIEFPDGMSEEEMHRSIAEHLSKAKTAAQPKPDYGAFGSDESLLAGQAPRFKTPEELNPPMQAIIPPGHPGPGAHDRKEELFNATVGAAFSPVTAFLPESIQNDIQSAAVRVGKAAFSPASILSGGMLAPTLAMLPESVTQSSPLTRPVVSKPVAEGISKGAYHLAEAFLSPVGVATLGMGSLPVTAQRAISLGFATQMGAEMPELASELGTEFGKPKEQRDAGRISELLTSAAGSAAFTTLAGKHGLAPRKPLPDAVAPGKAPKGLKAEDFPGARFDAELTGDAKSVWRFTVTDKSAGDANGAGFTVKAGSTPEQINAAKTAKIAEFAPEPAPEQAATSGDNTIAKDTVPDRVAVSASKLDRGNTVPGYVSITSKDNVRSGAPEAWKSAGHDFPEFSNLPDGNYSIADALSLSKEGNVEANPHNYTPAIRSAKGANPIVGKKRDIHNNILDRQGDAEAVFEAYRTADLDGGVNRGFVGPDGKTWVSKDDLGKKLGVKGPVDSQRLMDLQDASKPPTAPAATEPAPVGETKQPWEVTKDEYWEKMGGGRPEERGPSYEEHRIWVEAALRDKNPIPPEVLADYPSLKPTPPATPVETPAAEPTLESTPLDPQSGKPLTQETPEPAMTEFGLGGARPGQFTPPASGPTSIQNAVVTQERISREIEPAVQAAKRSFGTVWDDALAVVEKDPSKQDALISELRENPRALTDTEDALILHRQIDLQNEYGKAARDLNQAHEDGRLGDVDREQARVDYLSDQLLDIYNIGKASGTETGRGLNARKMLANQDFTLAEMETKARAAKGGRKLTDEEKTKLKNTSEKIEKTQKELDEHLDTKGDQAADETLSKIEKDAPKEPTDTSEQQGAVGEKIRAKVEAGDQDISSLVQRLARLFVESGVRERNALVTAVHDVLKDIDPGFTRRDTMDAISGYGRFKPLKKGEVEEVLRDLKGQMQQVAKLEDIEAKQPIQKTGVERRTPSDEERRLIQQVNEAKRKYGVVVTDPATQLRSALQQAKTFLTNRMSDLRQEIATRERIVKTKTPLKPDAELEALRAEYEQVKADHAEMFPKREITDEQRVVIAEKSLDRSIAKLEADLDAGKLKRDVTPSRTPQTESIVEKKAWLQALREHRKELLDAQKPKLTPEERAIQSLKSRLTRSVAEYERKLREGDFTPRKPKSVDISNDPEAIRLKTENERLKAEFQRGLDLDRLRRRTRGQKIYGGVKEALNLPRNILSSWDVSAVLRQGGFIAFGNPLRAARAIGPMFKSLTSETAALQLEQQILARPNAKDYASSKLYLAPQDSIRLSAQEEQIMSRLAHKIPGLRASNRAFVSFLNKLRADSFDAMKSSLESRGENLKPEELKAISNYINVATGRGNLGKAAAAAETMATVFFSPRLMASRFQLLAGEPLYRGSARTRTAIATEYAKTLVGLAAIYALGSLAGAELEDDPRSSDFGKLKFGNTRVDPLMGLAQATVLLSRLASGETKTLKGAVVPIRGEKIPYGGSSAADVIARFLRSKLSPVVGAGVNIASGENVVGEPVTARSTAQDMLIPLSFQDIQSVMIEQGIPAGTALEILQLFGMGLQHYEVKK